MAVDPVRHAQICKALEDASIDGVVCGAASNVLLLSGYWPVMGASVAVFSSDGDVRLVLPEDEAALASASSAARQVAYRPGGLDTLATPIEAIRQPLLETLQAMGLAGKRLTVEMDAHMQPATYSSSLQLHCGMVDLLRPAGLGVELLDCGPMLDGLKAVRTPVELAILRRACAVVEAGFARAKDSCVRVRRRAMWRQRRMRRSRLRRQQRVWSDRMGSSGACRDRTRLRLRPHTLARGDAGSKKAIWCWCMRTRVRTATGRTSRAPMLRDSQVCGRSRCGRRSTRQGLRR